MRVVLGAGCGSYNCPQPTALPTYYQQQIPQQLTYRYQMPTIPQQTYHYYYPANSYQIPPQKSATPVASQFSVSEAAEVRDKTTTYDEFEKELENLKSGTVTVKGLEQNNATTGKEPTITYIREYMPSEYAGRVLPYRPVPYMSIPLGCQQYAVQPFSYQRPMPAYVTAPPPLPPTIVQKQQLSVVPPPLNDCCGKCGAPCKFRSKLNVIALASKIFSSQFVPRRDADIEDEPKDPKCNSEKLKDIMNKYITRTVALSKRLVQKNAENEIGGFFSVFCSTDDFSYVARSEMFCQVQKNDIFCYAFKHN